MTSDVVSGTAMSVPVNTARSPAFALSTSAPRRITSMLRGRLPLGMSEEFSCTLHCCQSRNTERSKFSFHSLSFLHSARRHFVG